MLSSSEISSIKFSKSMTGYKTEEVETFLDAVHEDYESFERERQGYLVEIQKLNEKLAELNDSQNTINSVLLNAQRLADQIVAEANQKSEEILKNARANIEEITEQERVLSATFQQKADERREKLQYELDKTLSEGKSKAAAVDAATRDSVERQQALFDRLKIEVAAFKNDITKRYREHLELLQKLPDEVPTDPKTIAGLLGMAFDETPNIAEFLMQPQPKEEPETESEQPKEQPESGFVIDDITVHGESETPETVALELD